MLSFKENGGCQGFVQAARARGFPTSVIEHDTPNLWKAMSDVSCRLQEVAADVVCCHGYKADLLGYHAAKWAQVHAVAVSHGWTGESIKVRLYEALDQRCLRKMHHVICVSDGQAAKVRRAGVPAERITTIRNAVRAERFREKDVSGRQELERMFHYPITRIVGAAGRLSPEKGFEVLLGAAAEVIRQRDDIGFVWFGDGKLRARAHQQIKSMKLCGRVLLPGFTNRLDQLIPAFDVLAIPSFTEGLPCVLLEAQAAGVPVVATEVGGIPEALDHGMSGYLIPAGNASALARRILQTLSSESHRAALGAYGRRRIESEFTFAKQCRAYEDLLQRLIVNERPVISASSPRSVAVDEIAT